MGGGGGWWCRFLTGGGVFTLLRGCKNITAPLVQVNTQVLLFTYSETSQYISTSTLTKTDNLSDSKHKHDHRSVKGIYKTYDCL